MMSISSITNGENAKISLHKNILILFDTKQLDPKNYWDIQSRLLGGQRLEQHNVVDFVMNDMSNEQNINGAFIKVKPLVNTLSSMEVSRKYFHPDT